MSTDKESMIHEPDLNAVPEKPALVTEKTKSKKKKNEKITLTWDENAIEEHDQLRGTRMKVSFDLLCTILSFRLVLHSLLSLMLRS